MKGITQTINENTVKNITLTPANVKKFLKMRGMEQSTVDWYRETFDDGAWEDMKDTTFAKFLEMLANYNREDPSRYDYRSVALEPYIGYDNTVRDRLFRHLSDITSISYVSLYNKYFGK